MPNLRPGKGARIGAEVLPQTIEALNAIKELSAALEEGWDKTVAVATAAGYTYEADPQYGDKLWKPITYGRGEWRVSLVHQGDEYYLDFREWWRA